MRSLLLLKVLGRNLYLVKGTKDASGNMIHKDIGPFLKEKIAEYFKKENVPINLKYIDPGYYIRSVAAGTEDSIFCDVYARCAVHAAMAGKTEMIVGMRREFIHIPMEMATAARQKNFFK